MSWGIDIKAITDKKESDIDGIINKLPKELKGQLYKKGYRYIKLGELL